MRLLLVVALLPFCSSGDKEEERARVAAMPCKEQCVYKADRCRKSARKSARSKRSSLSAAEGFSRTRTSQRELDEVADEAADRMDECAADREDCLLLCRAKVADGHGN